MVSQLTSGLVPLRFVFASFIFRLCILCVIKHYPYIPSSPNHWHCDISLNLFTVPARSPCYSCMPLCIARLFTSRHVLSLSRPWSGSLLYSLLPFWTYFVFRFPVSSPQEERFTFVIISTLHASTPVLLHPLSLAIYIYTGSRITMSCSRN